MKSRRPNIDILAVVLDVGLMLENSAVFQSQVVGQMIALRDFGYRVGILAVVQDLERFHRTVGQRLLSADILVETVMDQGFLRNIFGMATALRRLRRRSTISHAYVRGIWGPLVLALANPLTRQSFVYDVRGALNDETSAVGTSGLKRRIYAALEAWGIRSAAHVSAVSGPLADAVSVAHSIDQVAVVPCCIDFASASVSEVDVPGRRAELGYGPREIILVYSGGLSHYQQVPAMLTLWRRLRNEPDVRFLLLTNDDPHSFPTVVGNLADFGERLRHLALPQTSVPAVLAAADIGFMLRDARELNRVSSPVKFPEYLAAGLAVVASPGVGDASLCILQNNLGTLVDPQHVDEAETELRDLILAVRENRQDFRRRAKQIANHSYSWSSMQSIFQSLYGGRSPRKSGIESQ